MPVRRETSPRIVKLGSARLSTTDAETVYFDFGTPDNINLATTTAGQPGYGYRPGDRIFVTLTTDTDGTTSTITLVALDAPDSSGSIGTTAAAITDGTLLTAAADATVQTSVILQPGRPWLKFGVTNSSATDTVLCYITVFAIPRVL
jgi:hypothetical protein